MPKSRPNSPDCGLWHDPDPVVNMKPSLVVALLLSTLCAGAAQPVKGPDPLPAAETQPGEVVVPVSDDVAALLAELTRAGVFDADDAAHRTRLMHGILSGVGCGTPECGAPEGEDGASEVDSVSLGTGVRYLRLRGFHAGLVGDLREALTGSAAPADTDADDPNDDSHPAGSAEPAAALTQAQEELALSGVILDLRDGNGGGMHAVEDTVALFEEADVALIVLVGPRTVSASERLAGELRDRKLGVLVGEKTAGYPFTSRELQLPSGIRIQIPDVDRTPAGRGTSSSPALQPDIHVAGRANQGSRDRPQLNADDLRRDPPVRKALDVLAAVSAFVSADSEADGEE